MDGAVAFTHYFLSKANEAYNKSDASLYQNLVLQSCKTCAAMTSTLDRYKQNQYRYVGDFVTATLVTINSFNGADVSVLVSNDTKASKVYGSNGNLVEEIPAARGNLAVLLDWSAASWRVAGIKGA